jgi:hypothetical protein
MTLVSRPATSPSLMLPEDAPNFNYPGFLRDITKVGPSAASDFFSILLRAF